MKLFRNNFSKLGISLFVLGLLTIPSVTNATLFDFTASNTETINEAIFTNVIPSGSVGSGSIESFVRWGGEEKTGITSGYNTAPKENFEFDTIGGGFTYPITLSQLVTVEGYYQFFLDINEPTPTSLLSIDAIEIYLSEDPNITGYAPLASPWDVLVYDMARDGILMDASLTSGSGKNFDLKMSVPVTLFDAKGATPDMNVVLYTMTGGGGGGGEYGDDGGYQEWKSDLSGGEPIPEPTTMLLFGTGMTVLAGIRLRRKKK